MSSEEDRRALERFVAGLPVEADALAHGITARAVERSIVVEAVVNGLSDADPVARRRLAQRTARMPELDPRIASRLAVLAGVDDDEQVREASAEALRVHGLELPSEPAAGTAGARLPRDLVLRLRVSFVRSEAPPVVRAEDPDEAPGLLGRLHLEATGAARLELTRLPPAFVGTTPTLRATGWAGPIDVGRADGPVSADAAVTIRIPATAATIDDLVDRLVAGAELLLPEG